MEEGRTLWIWSTLPKQPLVAENQTWRKEGDAVENVNRLQLGGHSEASFDKICSGTRPPYSVQHDLDTLACLVKLGRPGASVLIYEAVKEQDDNSNIKLKTINQLSALLKMSGFVNVEQAEIVEIDPDIDAEIREIFSLSQDAKFSVARFSCKLPDFAVGSSRLLSFASKIKPPVQEASKEQAWTIDLNDDDVDFIEEDTLLDEDDLKKPDPASLRVCGTTGQRKACKDCSCGLKEELEGETKVTSKSATSSCGSCYLGDAFRCASCPYLGMPAFKPGEKIQLSTRQLNPDN